MIALTTILAIAKFAPAVVGLLTNNKTSTQAAQLVSQTAQAITGTTDDEAALEVLKNDPDKVIEYKNAMNEYAATMYELENKRAETVNNTMHLEAANKSRYVRYMRPTFGYAVILMMMSMFFNITRVIGKDLDQAIKMIEAYASMEWVFVAMLAAIGVYITKRSKDKNPNALGMLGALAKRIGR